MNDKLLKNKRLFIGKDEKSYSTLVFDEMKLTPIDNSWHPCGKGHEAWAHHVYNKLCSINAI